MFDPVPHRIVDPASLVNAQRLLRECERAEAEYRAMAYACLALAMLAGVWVIAASLAPRLVPLGTSLGAFVAVMLAAFVAALIFNVLADRAQVDATQPTEA